MKLLLKGLSHIVFGVFFITFSSQLVLAQKADLSKMSAWVREIVYQQKDIRARKQQNKNYKAVQARSVPSLCALVKTTDNSSKALTDNGCRVIDRIGNIIIADIPLHHLESLSADNRILRIEAKQSNTIAMDTTVSLVGAEKVHNGLHLPQAFTGKGVVVGVQDVGFDLTHPTFFSRDMSEFRIKAFWDQLSTDTIGSTMYVGRDYEGKENLLQYGHSRDASIIAHGAHTTGIAAGSGYDTDYKGIALESDICLVSNAVTNDIPLIDSINLYKYTYATDLLGFKYICDYADRVGKPCVISFSEGSHQDLRGDDLLYYEALSELSKEGRIIVASAGNSGHLNTTIIKPYGKQKAGSYLYRDGNSVLATIEATDDISIRIIIHQNTIDKDTFEVSSRDVFLEEDSIIRDTLTTDKGTYTFYVRGYLSALDTNIKVFDVLYSAPKRIDWNEAAWLETEGTAADTRTIIINGQFENTFRQSPTGEAFKGYSIHSPSSAPDVICVGATTHRKGFTNIQGNYYQTPDKSQGERAFYSSLGPTIDERIKPDVMAPGTNIISSYNSFYLESQPEASDNASDVSRFEYNGRVYSWNANTGTSMSTPIVAGIIALWLEAKPTLTREEIMETFRATCYQPEPSINYPNNEYGYGSIDAYAGLLHILGLDESLSIDELSRNMPKNAEFILKDRTLTITSSDENMNGKITIYTTLGQVVLSEKVCKNYQTIDLNSLNQGVYAVQLSTNKHETSGSTLIRID